jgi:hypothetical protein
VTYLWALHIGGRPTTEAPDNLFRTEQEARDYARSLNRPVTVTRWSVGTRTHPVRDRTVIATYTP